MTKENLLKLSNLLKTKAEKSIISSFKYRDFYQYIESNDSFIIIGPRRIGKTTFLEEVLRSRIKVSSQNKMQVIESPDSFPKKNEVDGINKSAQKNEMHLSKIEDPAPNLEFPLESLTASESIIKTADNFSNDKVMYLKMDALEFISKTSEEMENIAMLIRDIVIELEIELLLIDEIQAIPNWIHLLKDIKDWRGNDTKILCTGSNSNELIKGTESGVGRFSIKFFGILSLKEYVNVWGENEIDGLILEDINTFNEYINFKHFPHYTNERYFQEVPEAVVEKSFSATATQKTHILKIIKWIANNPGITLNATNVSIAIRVRREYISDYLTSLQEGQLIFKLRNQKELGAQEKIYCLIPGIFTLYDGKKFETLNETEQGQHFENFVFIQLLSMTKSLAERLKWKYFKDNKKTPAEIDFVYDSTAFEVKRSLPSDYSKYITLCKENNIKILYFVTLNKNDKKADEIKDDVTIKFISWSDFAIGKKIEQIKGDLNVY